MESFNDIQQQISSFQSKYGNRFKIKAHEVMSDIDSDTILPTDTHATKQKITLLEQYQSNINLSLSELYEHPEYINAVKLINLGDTEPGTQQLYDLYMQKIKTKLSKLAVVESKLDALSNKTPDINSIDKTVNSNFERDFRMWLLGGGTDKDHVNTPWGRDSLVFLPGVTEYFDLFVSIRFSVLKYLVKLDILQPRNINEAYIYYKYIVTGDFDLNDDGQLGAWFSEMNRLKIDISKNRESTTWEESILKKKNFLKKQNSSILHDRLQTRLEMERLKPFNDINESINSMNDNFGILLEKNTNIPLRLDYTRKIGIEFKMHIGDLLKNGDSRFEYTYDNISNIINENGFNSDSFISYYNNFINPSRELNEDYLIFEDASFINSINSDVRFLLDLENNISKSFDDVSDLYRHNLNQFGSFNNAYYNSIYSLKSSGVSGLYDNMINLHENTNDLDTLVSDFTYNKYVLDIINKNITRSLSSINMNESTIFDSDIMRKKKYIDDLAISYGVNDIYSVLDKTKYVDIVGNMKNAFKANQSLLTFLNNPTDIVQFKNNRLNLNIKLDTSQFMSHILNQLGKLSDKNLFTDLDLINSFKSDVEAYVQNNNNYWLNDTPFNDDIYISQLYLEIENIWDEIKSLYDNNLSITPSDMIRQELLYTRLNDTYKDVKSNIYHYAMLDVLDGSALSSKVISVIDEKLFNLLDMPQNNYLKSDEDNEYVSDQSKLLLNIMKYVDGLDVSFQTSTIHTLLDNIDEPSFISNVRETLRNRFNYLSEHILLDTKENRNLLEYLGESTELLVSKDQLLFEKNLNKYDSFIIKNDDEYKEFISFYKSTTNDPYNIMDDDKYELLNNSFSQYINNTTNHLFKVNSTEYRNIINKLENPDNTVLIDDYVKPIDFNKFKKALETITSLPGTLQNEYNDLERLKNIFQKYDYNYKTYERHQSRLNGTYWNFIENTPTDNNLIQLLSSETGGHLDESSIDILTGKLTDALYDTTDILSNQYNSINLIKYQTESLQNNITSTILQEYGEVDLRPFVQQILDASKEIQNIQLNVNNLLKKERMTSEIFKTSPNIFKGYLNKAIPIYGNLGNIDRFNNLYTGIYNNLHNINTINKELNSIKLNVSEENIAKIPLIRSTLKLQKLNRLYSKIQNITSDLNDPNSNMINKIIPTFNAVQTDITDNEIFYDFASQSKSNFSDLILDRIETISNTLDDNNSKILESNLDLTSLTFLKNDVNDLLKHYNGLKETVQYFDLENNVQYVEIEPSISKLFNSIDDKMNLIKSSDKNEKTRLSVNLQNDIYNSTTDLKTRFKIMMDTFDTIKNIILDDGRIPNGYEDLIYTPINMYSNISPELIYKYTEINETYSNILKKHPYDNDDLDTSDLYTNKENFNNIIKYYSANVTEYKNELIDLKRYYSSMNKFITSNPIMVNHFKNIFDDGLDRFNNITSLLSENVQSYENTLKKLNGLSKLKNYNIASTKLNDAMMDDDFMGDISGYNYLLKDVLFKIDFSQEKTKFENLSQTIPSVRTSDIKTKFKKFNEFLDIESNINEILSTMSPTEEDIYLRENIASTINNYASEIIYPLQQKIAGDMDLFLVKLYDINTYTNILGRNVDEKYRAPQFMNDFTLFFKTIYDEKKKLYESYDKYHKLVTESYTKNQNDSVQELLSGAKNIYTARISNNIQYWDAIDHDYKILIDIINHYKITNGLPDDIFSRLNEIQFYNLPLADGQLPLSYLKEHIISQAQQIDIASINQKVNIATQNGTTDTTIDALNSISKALNSNTLDVQTKDRIYSNYGQMIFDLANTHYNNHLLDLEQISSNVEIYNQNKVTLNNLEVSPGMTKKDAYRRFKTEIDNAMASINTNLRYTKEGLKDLTNVYIALDKIPQTLSFNIQDQITSARNLESKYKNFEAYLESEKEKLERFNKTINYISSSDNIDQYTLNTLTNGDSETERIYNLANQLDATDMTNFKMQNSSILSKLKSSENSDVQTQIRFISQYFKKMTKAFEKANTSNTYFQFMRSGNMGIDDVNNYVRTYLSETIKSDLDKLKRNLESKIAEHINVLTEDRVLLTPHITYTVSQIKNEISRYNTDNTTYLTNIMNLFNDSSDLLQYSNQYDEFQIFNEIQNILSNQIQIIRDDNTVSMYTEEIQSFIQNVQRYNVSGYIQKLNNPSLFKDDIIDSINNNLNQYSETGKVEYMRNIVNSKKDSLTYKEISSNMAYIQSLINNNPNKKESILQTLNDIIEILNDNIQIRFNHIRDNLDMSDRNLNNISQSIVSGIDMSGERDNRINQTINLLTGYIDNISESIKLYENEYGKLILLHDNIDVITTEIPNSNITDMYNKMKLYHRSLKGIRDSIKNFKESKYSSELINHLFNENLNNLGFMNNQNNQQLKYIKQLLLPGNFKTFDNEISYLREKNESNEINSNIVNLMVKNLVDINKEINKYPEDVAIEIGLINTKNELYDNAYDIMSKYIHTALSNDLANRTNIQPVDIKSIYRLRIKLNDITTYLDQIQNNFQEEVYRFITEQTPGVFNESDYNSIYTKLVNQNYISGLQQLNSKYITSLYQLQGFENDKFDNVDPSNINQYIKQNYPNLIELSGFEENILKPLISYDTSSVDVLKRDLTNLALSDETFFKKARRLMNIMDRNKRIINHINRNKFISRLSMDDGNYIDLNELNTQLMGYMRNYIYTSMGDDNITRYLDADFYLFPDVYGGSPDSFDTKNIIQFIKANHARINAINNILLRVSENVTNFYFDISKIELHTKSELRDILTHMREYHLANIRGHIGLINDLKVTSELMKSLLIPTSLNYNFFKENVQFFPNDLYSNTFQTSSLIMGNILLKYESIMNNTSRPDIKYEDVKNELQQNNIEAVVEYDILNSDPLNESLDLIPSDNPIQTREGLTNIISQEQVDEHMVKLQKDFRYDDSNINELDLSEYMDEHVVYYDTLQQLWLPGIITLNDAGDYIIYPQSGLDEEIPISKMKYTIDWFFKNDKIIL